MELQRTISIHIFLVMSIHEDALGEKKNTTASTFHEPEPLFLLVQYKEIVYREQGLNEQD